MDNNLETPHIFSAFSRAANEHKNKPAIIFKDADGYKNISYGRLYAKAVEFGNILKNKGIKPQDRISLQLENCPEYPIAILGIMYAQATAVPLDIQIAPDETKRLIAHSASKIFITGEKNALSFNSQLPNTEIISVDSSAFKKESYGYATDERLDAEEVKNNLALLCYTSGTTGLPKAVMLTQANLLSNFNSLKKVGIIRSDDVILSVLPLHHTYPFTVTMLTPLLLGATVVYPPGLTSSDLLSCMRHTQTTILVAVPQMLSAIQRSINEKIGGFFVIRRSLISLLGNLSYILRSVLKINPGKRIFRSMREAFGEKLRFIASGGARLDPEIAKDFFKWGFTVLEGYGLTETSPVATFNPLNRPKFGSVGKPIPDVEIKIIAPDKKGIGEVAIKGPNVMAGYYNMERQTKEVLRDGWFLSGDLGYFDNEGYLYLTGRKKEIIVLSNGKNINPEEVEKHYAQSPFIKEICVFPVKGAGFLKGTEHLAAVIVINEDYFRAKNETNIREKIKWELDNLSSGLSPYKRISAFVVTKDALPRTRLGKIMRHKIEFVYAGLLEKSAAKKTSAQNAESRPTDTDTAGQVLKFLKKTLDRDVNPDDHLELDLGLDSLSRLELLMAMQKYLNIDASEEEAKDLFMSSTIKELTAKFSAIIPRDKMGISEDASFNWGKILQETPAPNTLKRIRLKHSPWEIAINILALCLLKAFFRVFFLLGVEGKSNLKSKGPYLICPNHTSYLDGLIVLSALPFRAALNTFFAGYSVIFEHFLMRGMIKTARLIPLEINTNLIEALKACAFVLRNKKIVCIFPEGHRSINEEVEEFKKGVGILIKELDIPVIPVYIKGGLSAWPRYRKLPRPAKIKITFGKIEGYSGLLNNAENAAIGGNEAYKLIVKSLRQKVAGLKE